MTLVSPPASPAPKLTGELAAAYSTYRIGGPVDALYCPTTIAEAEATLKQILPDVQNHAQPLQVLGWGSNTLIASAGLRGHTLVTRKMGSVEPLGDHCFRFGAGVHLAKVAHAMQQEGLVGGEFLVGIPGTMGGAACMNAGAMGSDTSMILNRVLVFDVQSGSSGWLEKEQLRFAYRFSDINSQTQIVLAAECRFEQGCEKTSKAKMEANLQFRKTNHPIEPNGGSVFRNVEGLPPVGKLVDDLGGRGVWHVGDAWVSEKHGNFIVNKGHASSLDVLELMCLIKRQVQDAHDVSLYPENRFIGEATAEEQACWQFLKEGDAHHGC